jgi:hypothetical protein
MIRQQCKVSLDSGTPETYLSFKGRNVFSLIVDNLSRYASNMTASKNITLKYIMANQNCSNEDIDGFIGVCKKMHINDVVLTPQIYENKNRVTTSDNIAQMAKFVRSCSAVGLSLVIFYSLFTDEYKKMLEDRLASEPIENPQEANKWQAWKMKLWRKFRGGA